MFFVCVFSMITIITGRYFLRPIAQTQWHYRWPVFIIFKGGSPYPRMEGRKIASLLQQGYRMPKPEHVDNDLWVLSMPFLIAIRKIHHLISQISNPVRPHKKLYFIWLLLSNQRRQSYKKYSRDVKDIEPNVIQPFTFSLDLLMSHSLCCL